jgi:hypothetical protein
LICNDGNVKLLNKKTGNIFQNQDTDNQSQKINRFNGLTEIIYGKNNLQSFKNTLLNDTLNKITIILKNFLKRKLILKKK